MEKRIKVYAGYYELYVTDKKLPLPKTFQASFDTAEEAWKYIDEADETTWIDEDIYFDMFGFFLALGEPIGNVFKVEEGSGKIITLSPDTVHLF